MAVKYYKKGEHPTGFVGFRVYHTVGGEGHERQKCFSNREHGYQLAKKLAHDLDREWIDEASRVKRKRRLSEPPSRGGVGVIVSGLRADISKRGKSLYVGFFVIIPGSTQSNYFGTKRAGYMQAWKNAVNNFCELYGYGLEEKSKLLSMVPDKSIFKNYLLDRHNSKGFSLSLNQLETYIDT